MFEKVLFPTDLSEHSKRMVGCIGQLPNVKEVVLLNVIVGEHLAKLRSAEEKLEEFAKCLGKADIIIKTKVEVIPRREGIEQEKIERESISKGISSVIRRVADEEGISLIVMDGAKGPVQVSPLGRAYPDVLCNDDTHLLLICCKLLGEENALRDDLCSHIFSKVLLPTDLSEPSKAVVSFIARLKGIKNIVLLHVVPKEGSKGEVEARAEAAANVLNAFAKELAGIDGLKVTPPLGVRLSKAALRCHICSKGLNIACHVAAGNAVEKINEMADKEDVSLIAMSSVGRRSFGGADVGNVGHTTYDIANTAMRPVLVIRSDKASMVR